MEYPNKCCQCGFCCLTETCHIGMSYYLIKKEVLCPGLIFTADGAYCQLVDVFGDKIMGIGAGCCISARCYKNGVAYDYSDLPDEVKKEVVENVRNSLLHMYSKQFSKIMK